MALGIGNFLESQKQGNYNQQNAFQTFQKGGQLAEDLAFKSQVQNIANSPMPGQNINARIAQAAFRTGKVDVGAQLQAQADQQAQAEAKNIYNTLITSFDAVRKTGNNDAVKNLIDNAREQYKDNPYIGPFLSAIDGSDITDNSITYTGEFNQDMAQQYPDLLKSGVKFGDSIKVKTDIDTGKIKEVIAGLGTQGKLTSQFWTDQKSGDVKQYIFNEQQQLVGVNTYSGVTRSSAQTGTQLSENVKARETAKIPFTDRAERRKIIRSTEYTGTNTALNSLSDAMEILDKNPEVYKDLIGKKLGQGEAAKFNTKVQTGIRLFVQSISGKVVTDAEAKAFQEAYAPQFFNSPDIAKFKLEALQEILELNKQLMIDPENEGLKSEIQNVVNDVISSSENPGEETKKDSLNLGL